MKPCLFSVSYAGLWGQAALSLPEFIAHAGRLGYPSVMLMAKRPHLSPLDATPAAVETLKQTFREARLRCDVLAGYTHLAPGIAAEVPVIEFQIAYVESLARLASSPPTKRTGRIRRRSGNGSWRHSAKCATARRLTA